MVGPVIAHQPDQLQDVPGHPSGNEAPGSASLLDLALVGKGRVVSNFGFDLLGCHKHWPF